MSNDLTKTFTVDATPERVYDVINDVRGWWGGLVGRNDLLGAEWVYFVPDIHFSKFRTTELVPAKRIAWLVTDSELSFLEDKQEWTGTTVEFDLAEVDGGTEVRFTHRGLTPQVECYEVCDLAWSEYIVGSLQRHIVAGAGDPNSFEGDDAVNAARARRDAALA
jgi:uncharacterized protein YndB with AHSA1/START domain